MNRSPLLPIIAILLIGISTILFFFKINERKNDLDYISDGITTKAKLELKKDSTGKDTSGNIISFICISYRITAEIKDSVKHDSLYLDSIAAMKRMMIAENFKIDIPGMKFSTIPVQKKSFDKLHEGDSLKIVYSSYDTEHVRLEEENSAPVDDKTKTTWITVSIICFMAGIWLLILNKRRRSQGQESDPLSGMTTYSTIKKDEGPKTGGRPE